MLRLPFLAAAVLAIVSSALPACGPGEGVAAPDANLCAGWAPSSTACDEAECESRGGCTLESCDPTNGQTTQIVCESPPAPIDGAWSIRTLLQGEDPCPEVVRVDETQLVVQSGPTSVTAAILDPEGHLLDTAEVNLEFAQTAVRFALHPTWTGPEGAEIQAHVDYDVTVFSGGSITGTATGIATSGATTCNYEFNVDGNRN